LGGNAKIDECARRILEVKKRNHNPFLVAAPSREWILENCEAVNESVENILADKLPGPYSFILKLRNLEAVGPFVRDGRDTAGIRIPDNWFSRLIAKSGVPFISTSVNYAGQPSAGKFENIPGEILESVDYIIKDDLSVSGRGSTIIDLTDGSERIIRK
jgi:tRNA threonylcarbamoyl adenosine modification protein (Sua5/YciO/YrdC/YwlC family)